MSTIRSHRYATLLGLLVVLLTVQSLDKLSRLDYLLSDLTRTLLGIGILLVAFERRRERRIAGTV